jgi:hypothetical protein
MARSASGRAICSSGSNGPKVAVNRRGKRETSALFIFSKGSSLHPSHFVKNERTVAQITVEKMTDFC